MNSTDVNVHMTRIRSVAAAEIHSTAIYGWIWGCANTLGTAACLCDVARWKIYREYKTQYFRTAWNMMQILNVRPCRKCKLYPFALHIWYATNARYHPLNECVCILLRSFFEFHPMITHGEGRTYFGSQACRLQTNTAGWVASPWACDWLCNVCGFFLVWQTSGIH